MPVVSEVSPLEVTRRARGLSQSELADLAGVSQATVSLIKRGAVPRVRTAHRIARALSVDLDALFPVKDETPAINPGSRDNSVDLTDRYGCAE